MKIGERSTTAMHTTPTKLSDVLVVEPSRNADDRGFFSETYNRRAFAEAGIDVEFVQDNHSMSRPVGTVRGLHYQIAPMGQAKLVRVVRGAIFDVAVDLRRDSSTFGRFASVILSAENGKQLFVPVGFAHGFATMEPDTEVVYKVSAYWSRAHERSLLWNDAELGIDWPVAPAKALLSPKDRTAPPFRSLEDFF